MKNNNSASIPSSSNNPRPVKLVFLCVPLIAALLCGCVSSEGDVRTAALIKEEPFQSLLGKRVTLLRPIHIRERPAYVGDSFSSDMSSDDIAWVAGFNGDHGASSKWEDHGGDAEKLLVGRTLPAGTVIRLKRFSFVRPYALAWLPGQGMNIPWYPGRGLFPYQTKFYAMFTSETTSAIGRPFGAEIVLGYRWGYGPRLWAAPWEPEGKEPVFVGNLGRSFKSSH